MTEDQQLYELWRNRESPFFGERWDAPSTDEATQVETPVGQRCYSCDREIVEGDQGWIRPYIKAEDDFSMRPIHLGCDLGSTIGHTFGYCNCNGWTDHYWRGKALLQHLEGMKRGRNSNEATE